MKIWLIYKVARAFWIDIHGCPPYPRNSHLYNKSPQKQYIAIVSNCIIKKIEVGLRETLAPKWSESFFLPWRWRNSNSLCLLTTDRIPLSQHLS